MILIFAAVLPLLGNIAHFSIFRFMAFAYIWVCIGVAALAIIAGPDDRPLERFAMRCSSLIRLEGRLEFFAFIIMLAFPLFQLSLIFVAWHTNWSQWLSRPDLANVMSFWAITVAATIGTSTAEYKAGALTENLANDDSLELAKRLDEILARSYRKGTASLAYLAIGVLTQVIYWIGTMHLGKLA